MGRVRLWHSRSLLSLTSLLLTLAILLVDYVSLPSNHEIKDQSTEEGDLMKDVDYVMDAIEYLHAARSGHAHVLPVVENERKVRELYWSCRLRRRRRGGNEMGDAREDKRGEDRGKKTHRWTTNDLFHVFSAHIDTRPNSLYPHSNAIQVLAMSYRTPNITVYCNIFSGQSSTVVEATVREIWQRGWDPRGNFIVPLLITCPIPNWMVGEEKIEVQLTTRFCRTEEETIPVLVPSTRRPKAKVAVCVKGMDFDHDISTSLVEWIEMQLLFGADSISIYVYSVPPIVEKVLNKYESEGKIQVMYIDLPGDESPHIPLVRSQYTKRNRQQKRRHELIPYNDCLYRHLNSHEYILIVDTDEVVVPLVHKSWTELLEEAESSSHDRLFSSLSLRNVFKFPHNETLDDRNSRLPYLTNRIRSRKTSKKGDYGKSFSSTSHVASVFNHFSLHRLSPSISSTVYIPEHSALKLHYKSSCPIESRHECPEMIGDTVEDRSLDRFSVQLEERVKESRRVIGLD